MAGSLCDGPHAGVNEALERVALVDHHVHSIMSGRIDAAAFAGLLSESDRPAAARAAGWDSQLGFAVRRWCAPLLGLVPHASREGYLDHRLSLTNEEAAAVFLPAAGLDELLIDTGFRAPELVAVDTLGRLARARTRTIVRLETVAEDLIRSGVDAAGYASAFRDALAAALATSVGCKSVIAYRQGLDFDPTPPAAAEVTAAAGAWLRDIEATGSVRLIDPVLLRFGLWEGARTGRPLQVHTGFGDTDLDLARADPALLTDFLRATEAVCPVLLLHTYPFQRNAGYLAQMFAHVYVDVGLAVNHSGAASDRIIAETLEMAPFRKVLFSSDAWGLPELHLLGSWLFRRGLSRVIGGWVADGDWSLRDAERAIDAARGRQRGTGLWRLSLCALEPWFTGAECAP